MNITLTIWGLDPSIQEGPMELGTEFTTKEIMKIKAEWKAMSPGMKFHFIPNAQPGQQPVGDRWY